MGIRFLGGASDLVGEEKNFLSNVEIFFYVVIYREIDSFIFFIFILFFFFCEWGSKSKSENKEVSSRNYLIRKMERLIRF